MLYIVAVTIATSVCLFHVSYLVSIINMLYIVAVTIATSLFLSVSCQLFGVY